MTEITETQPRYTTISQMDEEFAQLEYTATVFPEGFFHGRILAFGGPGFLLAPLQLPASAIDGINPWRGKSFWGDRGANRWISDSRDAHYGHFRVEIGKSVLDGRKTLLLDYDVPENPALLRRILGEARQIPGAYLCRMLYRTGAAPLELLYFTLKKETQVSLP